MGKGWISRKSTAQPPQQRQQRGDQHGWRSTPVSNIRPTTPVHPAAVTGSATTASPDGQSASASGRCRRPRQQLKVSSTLPTSRPAPATQDCRKAGGQPELSGRQVEDSQGQRAEQPSGFLFVVVYLKCSGPTVRHEPVKGTGSLSGQGIRRVTMSLVHRLGHQHPPTRRHVHPADAASRAPSTAPLPPKCFFLTVPTFQYLHQSAGYNLNRPNTPVKGLNAVLVSSKCGGDSRTWRCTGCAWSPRPTRFSVTPA